MTALAIRVPSVPAAGSGEGGSGEGGSGPGEGRTDQGDPGDATEQDGPNDDYDGLGLPVDETTSDLDEEPGGDFGVGLLVAPSVPLDAPKQDTEPLDIGAVLPVGCEEQARADDDLPGFPAMEDALEGTEPTGSVADEEEPPWDDDAGLSGKLPELDADDEGASPQEEGWGVTEDPRDDPLPPDAAVLWHERHLPRAEMPCQTLALGLGVVVGAGPNLYWLAGSAAAPTRVSPGVGRIENLVLVGQTRQYVLCATTRGALVVWRQDGSTEVVEGWRQLAGTDPHRTERLELCQLGDDCPPVVLARTSGGRLLRSTRGGSDWQHVPLRGQVTALSAHGSPVAAMGRVGERRVLWRSEDLGTTFTETELGDEARRIAECDKPLVCTVKDTVALAHPDRGVVVSTDRGRSFRRVHGCAGITALAAGELEGRPAVFAALLVESEDRTELVVISPARAEAQRVGSLLPSARVTEAFEDESVERARTNAMRWDGDSRCLWLAGNFGLTSWFPPRLTNA